MSFYTNFIYSSEEKYRIPYASLATKGYQEMGCKIEYIKYNLVLGRSITPYHKP